MFNCCLVGTVCMVMCLLTVADTVRSPTGICAQTFCYVMEHLNLINQTKELSLKKKSLLIIKKTRGVSIKVLIAIN